MVSGIFKERIEHVGRPRGRLCPSGRRRLLRCVRREAACRCYGKESRDQPPCSPRAHIKVAPRHSLSEMKSPHPRKLCSSRRLRQALLPREGTGGPSPARRLSGSLLSLAQLSAKRLPAPAL
jgi:hypothetical protein